MKHVAMLLRTGKFSDLKLVCQETEFLVHTAIVSAGSAVWEAATQGNFKVMIVSIQAKTCVPLLTRGRKRPSRE